MIPVTHTQEREMSETIECPNCGQHLQTRLRAELPDSTDLTLTLTVEPGQFVRLDTIGGVLTEWRKLQIAVGESLGSQTDVFLAGMEMGDNEIRFTTRIVNTPTSAPSA